MGVLGRNFSPPTLLEFAPPYIAGDIQAYQLLCYLLSVREMVLPKVSTISNFLAEARRFESQGVPRTSDSCLSSH